MSSVSNLGGNSGVDQGNPKNNRKREREDWNTSTSIIDHERASQQPGKFKKTKPQKPQTQSKGSSQSESVSPVSRVIEWPELFKSLDKTHRALNLVFTFCCTRKHLATTFETIKSAVETHTKHPLTEDDVALIVALRPEGINFTYVDELMLQLDIKGSQRDDVFKNSKSLRSQAPVHDLSVGGWTGDETLHNRRDGESTGEREILFFEFIDGDLKRQVQDKRTGEAVAPNRRLRDEQLKMPVFGQKQMRQLIDRRNQKFASAIDTFLSQCVEDRLDPDMTLRHMAQKFLPRPSHPRVVADTIPSPIPENIPKDRKSIPEIVQQLKDSPWYTGQIVPDGHRVFDPQEPIYGDLGFLLSQDIVNALYNAKGITKIYAHQAEALNRLDQGEHVVVATSTSSGKSLIYQLPILCELERNYDSRALYIFPTKALAQDQKRSLRDMLSYMPGLGDALVETFDGDTPMNERAAIREQARIIFTNPDMLHATILPQEEKWRTFLKNLKYVVGPWQPAPSGYVNKRLIEAGSSG
ncbi:hypothetical protein UVI_02043430 [Ustilaginoidea virens]|uniref:Helicase ATP-binding domain-containing protein n=1 Tax=Ustilaginoidea virens TaxID=1159556 RepID=A0A1B5KXF1_USTVR|nr:hypothetical protein UVI_02043430 [Ustilaginoidea virens]